MADLPTHLREWIIQKKPMDEKLTKEHFRLRTVSLADQPKDGKLLVRIL
jgi:ribosomal protein S10